MKPIIYDSNITIIEVVDSPFMVNRNRTRPLKDNEYYATMVTDYNKYSRPKEDYFNFSLSWIGLEQTSKPNRVYISKDYNKRHDRGETVIVTVLNKSLCYEL